MDDAQYGARAWVLLHDLTRGAEPGLPPSHVDPRIAVRLPFGRRPADAPCPVGRGRVTYYKTVPEAAFVLAQQYLKRYKRPPVLPIHRHTEGHEPSEFKNHFGPAEPPGCCCTIS